MSCHVWQCVCVYLSHSASGPTPWLKCGHASVHVYMSTWLPMSALLLSKETYQLQLGIMWKPGCSCLALYVCPSHTTAGATPWLKYLHASIHVYMSTWLTISASPIWIVIWKPGCHCMAPCVCVPVTLIVVLHLGWNVDMHQYMYLCPPSTQC